ncbi:dual specificity protein phosphatase family protein [Chloroflexota bacterium]
MNFSWLVDGQLAGHQAPSSEQDLIWLQAQGVLALVRMAEIHKSQLNSHQIEQFGILDWHEPVTDMTAPKPAQINRVIQFIMKSLSQGKPVGVSCGAGLGRTGTILACYLVNQGFTPELAIKEVRVKRPGSIETLGQEEAIKGYAKYQKT